jgi:hypothetical protein
VWCAAQRTDVAILENRAWALSSCASDDGNRNEAGAYWGQMYEHLLTRQAI